MSTGVVYRSARGYELLMRALYGRHYGVRMRAVAEQVPRGSTVLELVARLRQAGVDARRVDLADHEEPLPSAEVMIMQAASLCHFLPQAKHLVERMLTAAAWRVILSEPVRNLATSDHQWVRALGARAADPGVGGHTSRFTERTLDELMALWSVRILDSFQIPGGREKVYVLAGGG